MSKPLCIDISMKGGTVVIDASDESLVRGLTGWHVNRQGYAVAFTWRPRRATLMHRLITAAATGTHVDHINGNKLDNRRVNLRVTTPQGNQANRKRLNRNNSSGARGVSYAPDRSRVHPWSASISVKGKNVHLGRFPNREEAIGARKMAELAYFGEVCP